LGAAWPTVGSAHFGRTTGPEAKNAHDVVARLPMAASATRSMFFILPGVALEKLERLTSKILFSKKNKQTGFYIFFVFLIFTPFLTLE
jgi:hypothetical protein